MIYQQVGEPFEATYSAGASGLVGTLEVAILDNDGNEVFGPTTAGIIENDVGGVGIGLYTAELVAPSSTGQFSIVFSPDGTWDPATTSSPEDLMVVSSLVLEPLPPLPPLPAGSVEAVGLCSVWTTVEEALACCADLGTDSVTEVETVVATELLFAASGYRWPGACERTVRPCPGSCGCFPVGWGGSIDGWGGSSWSLVGGSRRGCRSPSFVKLAGRPREIVSVAIDGVVLDPSEYRLVQDRLIRLNDAEGRPQRWPGCQDLGLEDGPGTFLVTYAYGADPPVAGRLAAAQLACELALACPGADGGAVADCAIPAHAVRVERRGMTIELDPAAARSWLSGGNTGLPLVDAFLGTFGTSRRMPTVLMAPEIAPYAQEG